MEQSADPAKSRCQRLLEWAKAAPLFTKKREDMMRAANTLLILTAASLTLYAGSGLILPGTTSSTRSTHDWCVLYYTSVHTDFKLHGEIPDEYKDGGQSIVKNLSCCYTKFMGYNDVLRSLSERFSSLVVLEIILDGNVILDKCCDLEFENLESFKVAGLHLCAITLKHIQEGRFTCDKLKHLSLLSDEKGGATCKKTVIPWEYHVTFGGLFDNMPKKLEFFNYQNPDCMFNESLKTDFNKCLKFVGDFDKVPKDINWGSVEYISVRGEIKRLSKGTNTMKRLLRNLYAPATSSSSVSTGTLSPTVTTHPSKKRCLSAYDCFPTSGAQCPSNTVRRTLSSPTPFGHPFHQSFATPFAPGFQGSGSQNIATTSGQTYFSGGKTTHSHPDHARSDFTPQPSSFEQRISRGSVPTTQVHQTHGGQQPLTYFQYGATASMPTNVCQSGLGSTTQPGTFGPRSSNTAIPADQAQQDTQPIDYYPDGAGAQPSTPFSHTGLGFPIQTGNIGQQISGGGVPTISADQTQQGTQPLIYYQDKAGAQGPTDVSHTGPGLVNQSHSLGPQAPGVSTHGMQAHHSQYVQQPPPSPANPDLQYWIDFLKEH